MKKIEKVGWVVLVVVVVAVTTLSFWFVSETKRMRFNNEVATAKMEVDKIQFAVSIFELEQKILEIEFAQKYKAWAKERKEAIRKTKRKYGGRIRDIAGKFGVDPDLVLAVIVVESSGDSRAVSSSKAKGLMQLKYRTARSVGITDLFHPYRNIVGGTKYLKRLQKRFGDVDTALAAYNLGPTRVSEFLQNGFNPSVFEYVLRVRAVLKTI